jgi:hypothetical protein
MNQWKKMRHRRSAEPYDRLTITLAPGQRDALESIAERNHATLAFVVRHALDKFMRENQGGQLRLDLPEGR